MKHPHFSQPYGWLCTVVMPLRSSYRYTVTVLVTSILVYGWYYLFYQPLQGYITHAATMLTTACHTRDTQAQQATTTPRLPATIDELRATVTTYNKSWHDEGVNLIIKSTHETGMRFIGCSLATVHEHDLGTRETISCQSEGSFDQYIHFLTKLFQTPHLYASCTNFTFTHSGNKDNKGTITFDLVVLHAHE